MSLTLTYDPTLSRVRAAAAGLIDAATFRLERSTDQVRWTTVRGASALLPSAGAASADDYEFAPDVPNFYRLRGPVVFDDYGRSVGAGGLGTATSGQTYILVGTAADFSVTGAVARVATVTINSMYIATVDTGQPHHRVRFQATVPVVPTGAGITLRAFGRYTDSSNYYQAVLSIAAGGAATLELFKNVAGVGTSISSAVSVGTHSAGNTWRGELFVHGDAIEAKVWKSTAAEPATYQLSVHDTSLTTGNRAGFGVRRETGNTNGTVNVDFDNLVVESPEATTFGGVVVVGSDNFTRTVVNDWGTAPMGGAWTSSGGVAGDYDVNGSQGTIAVGATLSARSEVSALSATDADITIHFATDKLVTGGGRQELAIAARRTDDDNTYLFRCGFQLDQSVTADIQKRVAGVQTPVTSTVTIAGLTHVAGGFYGLRARLVGSELRIRVWRIAQGEPATWTVVGTDTSIPGAGNVGLRAILGSGHTNLPVLFTVDNWTVTTPPLDIMPMLNTVWIKSIARPFLNRSVTVVDFSEVTRRARSGVFDVVGRSDPIAVSDVRGSPQWTMKILTEDLTAARGMDLVLASGDPLFIHVPAAEMVPGGYVTVGDTTEERPGRRSARRVFSLPCTQTVPPGPDVVGATVTWQGVVNAYATWTDVLAAHPTWASLLELVGSAEDVIVP